MELSERDKRSAIGHQGIEILGPLSGATLARFVQLVPKGARIVDIGSGKADFSRRVLRADPSATALGIDLNPVFGADANALAEADGTAGRLKLFIGDIAGWSPEPPYDAVVCLGASQALGTWKDAAQFAHKILRPGGVFVLGDGIWSGEPSQTLLEYLGCTLDDMPWPEDVCAYLGEAGFTLGQSHISTRAEWDAYEEPYFANLRAYRDETGAAPYVDFANDFERMQQTQGRGVMGFMTVAAFKT